MADLRRLNRSAGTQAYIRLGASLHTGDPTGRHSPTRDHLQSAAMLHGCDAPF